MGPHCKIINNKASKPCQDVEKVAKRRQRQRAEAAVLDCSSQSVEFTECCERATTPSVLELARPCTWLQ